PAGVDVTDSDTAAVDVVHPSITVAKTPDSQQVPSGSPVTFHIKVANDGDVALTNVEVTEAVAPVGWKSIGTLAAGGESEYDGTKPNATASFTNTADVSGKPPVGDDVTDEDTADVTVIHPSIDVQKTPDNQQIVAGGTASFHIVVTNDGDVALTSVEVTDVPAPGCAKSIGDLAQGPSVE